MSVDSLKHIWGRVFDVPLAIYPPKLREIMAVLAPRLDIEYPLAAHAGLHEERSRKAYTVVDGVAMIDVHGTLVHRSSGMDSVSGLTSYEQLSGELRQSLDDSEVKAVLLDVDSSGGEVRGVFDFADQVFSARGRKPIAAVANDYAASAAYMISAAADRFFVSQSAVVGSIGVIMQHADQSKLNEKMGVSITDIHAGARKADASPNRPLDDDAHAELQRHVDTFYDSMTAMIGQFRGARLTKADAMKTEAAIYIGQEAVDKGLADQVATVDGAASYLRDISATESSGAAMGAAKNHRPTANTPPQETDPMDKQLHAELEKLRAENGERDRALEDANQRAEAAETRASATRDAQIDQIIDANRDRIGPTMLDHVKAFAESCCDDVERFRSFVAALEIQENAETQSAAGSQNARTEGSGELSDAEKSVCRKVDMSEQAYRAYSQVVSWTSDGKMLLEDGRTVTKKELESWQH